MPDTNKSVKGDLSAETFGRCVSLMEDCLSGGESGLGIVLMAMLAARTEDGETHGPVLSQITDVCHALAVTNDVRRKARQTAAAGPKAPETDVVLAGHEWKIND